MFEKHQSPRSAPDPPIQRQGRKGGSLGRFPSALPAGLGSGGRHHAHQRRRDPRGRLRTEHLGVVDQPQVEDLARGAAQQVGEHRADVAEVAADLGREAGEGRKVAAREQVQLLLDAAARPGHRGLVGEREALPLGRAIAGAVVDGVGRGHHRHLRRERLELGRARKVHRIVAHQEREPRVHPRRRLALASGGQSEQGREVVEGELLGAEGIACLVDAAEPGARAGVARAGARDGRGLGLHAVVQHPEGQHVLRSRADDGARHGGGEIAADGQARVREDEGPAWGQVDLKGAVEPLGQAHRSERSALFGVELLPLRGGLQPLAS